MCDHPMHVEPANRAESSWKGDEGGCFPGHPSIETPWKPHVLAQVPFNSNLFFLRPAALSAACTDGGTKTAFWPCTTWSLAQASCHKALGTLR